MAIHGEAMVRGRTWNKGRWGWNGRIRLAGAVAATGLVALGLLAVLPSPAGATQAVTQIAQESFTGTSADASYYLANTEANSGTANSACLTAGTSSSTAIPGCSPSSPTAPGDGALQLTTAKGNEVGAVFSDQPIPTTEGVDVTFDSYQFGGNGADGIAFILGAIAPGEADNTTATDGPVGGHLGYSGGAASPSGDGFVDGYLGVGLDAYGNYGSASYGGAGCSSNSEGYSPENVTVRGPGDSENEYCILATTGGLSSPATLTGGSSGTESTSQVPVEVAINPYSTQVTTGSGLQVPAESYAVRFTPIGGTQQTVSGALPSTSNGMLAAAGIPSSWINPDTGIPYDLQFGWSGSTGGSDDVHEVRNLTIQTLNGELPVLALADSSSTADAADGSTVTTTLDPSVSSGGGEETTPITVSENLPTGFAFDSASGSGYTCSFASPVVSCVYPASQGSPVAAGTSLPSITVVATPGSSAATSNTITPAITSSDDYQAGPPVATGTPVAGNALSVDTYDHGTVSGTVLADPDGAGYQAGDLGISGQTVELSDGADTYTAVTGSGGTFSFDDVAYGTYTVREQLSGYNPETGPAADGGLPTAGGLSGLVVNGTSDNDDAGIDLLATPQPDYALTLTGPGTVQTPSGYTVDLSTDLDGGFAAGTSVLTYRLSGDSATIASWTGGGGYTCSSGGDGTTLTCDLAGPVSNTSTTPEDLGDFQIHVDVPDGFTGTLGSTATLTAASGAGSEGTASSGSNAEPYPEWSVASSASQGSLLAGETDQITVTPSNSGGPETSPVTISDSFPSDLEVQSARGNADTACTVSGQTVSCTTSPGSAAGPVTVDVQLVDQPTATSDTDAPVILSADNLGSAGQVGATTPGTPVTISTAQEVAGVVTVAADGDGSASPSGLAVTLSNGTNAYATTTASGGSFSFASVAPGTGYTLGVSGPGVNAGPVAIAPGSSGTTADTATDDIVDAISVTPGADQNGYQLAMLPAPTYQVGLVASGGQVYRSPGHLSYTVSPTIVSGASDEPVIAELDLPSGVSYDSTAPNSAWSCSDDLAAVTCDYQSDGTQSEPLTSATALPPIVVEASTAPGIAPGTTETATAEVYQPPATGNYVEGTASDAGAAQMAPVLAVRSTIDPGSASIGAALQLTLTPSDVGGVEDSAVTVTDALPAGLVPVASSLPSGCTTADASLSCTISPPAGGGPTPLDPVVVPLTFASAAAASQVTDSPSIASPDNANASGTEGPGYVAAGTPFTLEVATTLSGTVDNTAIGSGQPGVLITATSTGGGAPASASDVTGPAGGWSISGLPAGTYQLTARAPRGMQINSTSAGSGADGRSTPDGTAGPGGITGITTVWGGDGRGYDFYIGNASAFQVGDRASVVPVSPGGSVTYTVTPRIDNGANAYPLQLTDNLAVGKVEVRSVASPGDWHCSVDRAADRVLCLDRSTGIAPGSDLGNIDIVASVGGGTGGDVIDNLATLSSPAAGTTGMVADATADVPARLPALAADLATSPPSTQQAVGKPFTVLVGGGLRPTGGAAVAPVTLRTVIPSGLHIDRVVVPSGALECLRAGREVTCVYGASPGRPLAPDARLDPVAVVVTALHTGRFAIAVRATYRLDGALRAAASAAASAVSAAVPPEGSTTPTTTTTAAAPGRGGTPGVPTSVPTGAHGRPYALGFTLLGLGTAALLASSGRRRRRRPAA